VDDRIRISDADRDRVTARLRDHFAEGRLTSDELDERVTAALNAKTFGELRRVMADLPEPAPTSPGAQRPPRTPPPWAFRRRPRILPLVLLAVLAVVLIPGSGWLLFAFIKFVLVFWLVAVLAGIFVTGRIRRRLRRDWWAGQAYHGHYQGWPRYPQQWSRCSRW
jgi:DUF1707 SHOCT-like domain